MAKTYAEFKAYLADFLWKANDLDLINNLDSLILMANSELSSKLNIQRRQQTVLITPTSENYQLPADFRTMVSLALVANTTADWAMKATTLSDLYAKRAYAPTVFRPVYVVDNTDSGKVLRLVGDFSEGDVDLTLTYRTNVPNYAAQDSSWLEEDYLDLYVYTILSHCAPFLREDERIPLWVKMKDIALVAALEENAHMVDHGGSPLQMRSARPVPSTRER